MEKKPRCRVEFCYRPVTHFTVRTFDARNYKSGGTVPDVRKTVAYFCAWHGPQAAEPIGDADPTP
jgi:hypothetical protein